MYMLALCDDQPAHAERIRRAIKSAFAVRSVPATADTCTDANDPQSRLFRGSCHDVFLPDIDI